MICNMHNILDVSEERERNSVRGNKFYSTHEGYYLKGTAVEISTLSARCHRAGPFSKSNPYPLPDYPCHHLLLLDIRSSVMYNKRRDLCGFTCATWFFSVSFRARPTHAYCSYILFYLTGIRHIICVVM